LSQRFENILLEQVLLLEEEFVKGPKDFGVDLGEALEDSFQAK